MRFCDIPAHESIKTRLRNMADSGRLPHALLLEGPQGIGKLAMARAFAQYIHCKNHTSDGDSCGACPSCIQHRNLNHLDTIYSFPVIGSTTSDDYLDDWKQFLSESTVASADRWVEILNSSKGNTQPLIYVAESASLLRKLSFTGHSSSFRIVIMWLPERLQDAAANKLLKMIEEPFADTLFIMASNSPADIIPTIYSRLQRVEMHALPDAVVARTLVDNLGIDSTDALAIAHTAEGNILTARQLVNGNSDRKMYMDLFISLMRLAYQRDVRELREWAGNLAKLGREKEMRFYEYAQQMIRENFVYNFNIPELVYLDRDEKNFSSRFARFITEQNAEGLSETFSNAHDDIAGNGNGKIINFDTAIKVIFLIKNA